MRETCLTFVLALNMAVTEHCFPGSKDFFFFLVLDFFVQGIKVNEAHSHIYITEKVIRK